MPKAGIVRPDDDFLIILYDGEIAPTSPVKTYFPVIEQTVQSIVKDYILRNATLQSFSGREQPQPVGLVLSRRNRERSLCVHVHGIA